MAAAAAWACTGRSPVHAQAIKVRTAAISRQRCNPCEAGRVMGVFLGGMPEGGKNARQVPRFYTGRRADSTGSEKHPEDDEDQ